jgi:hypothetical protein
LHSELPGTENPRFRNLKYREIEVSKTRNLQSLLRARKTYFKIEMSFIFLELAYNIVVVRGGLMA